MRHGPRRRALPFIPALPRYAAKPGFILGQALFFLSPIGSLKYIELLGRSALLSAFAEAPVGNVQSPPVRGSLPRLFSRTNPLPSFCSNAVSDVFHAIPLWVNFCACAKSPLIESVFFFSPPFKYAVFRHFFAGIFSLFPHTPLLCFSSSCKSFLSNAIFFLFFEECVLFPRAHNPRGKVSLMRDRLLPAFSSDAWIFPKARWPLLLDFEKAEGPQSAKLFFPFSSPRSVLTFYHIQDNFPVIDELIFDFDSTSWPLREETWIPLPRRARAMSPLSHHVFPVSTIRFGAFRMILFPFRDFRIVRFPYLLLSSGALSSSANCRHRCDDFGANIRGFPRDRYFLFLPLNAVEPRVKLRTPPPPSQRELRKRRIFRSSLAPPSRTLGRRGVLSLFPPTVAGFL